MRERYNRELTELQGQVVTMSSMVQKAVAASIDALKARDVRAAERIIADDKAINTLRFEIEDAALLIIATQQPMARDLRLLLAATHISTDLERMGDYAAGIAKICLMDADQPPVKPLIDIPRMGAIANEMLQRATEAYLAGDVDVARAICARDDEVDALYDQVYRELLTIMIEDPHTIRRATHLLWAAHNVERIADRVTNICERIVFTVTGHMEQMDVSTY